MGAQTLIQSPDLGGQVGAGLILLAFRQDAEVAGFHPGQGVLDLSAAGFGALQKTLQERRVPGNVMQDPRGFIVDHHSQHCVEAIGSLPSCSPVRQLCDVVPCLDHCGNGQNELCTGLHSVVHLFVERSGVLIEARDRDEVADDAGIQKNNAFHQRAPRKLSNSE